MYYLFTFLGDKHYSSIDVHCKINNIYLSTVSINEQHTIRLLLISYYLTDKNFLNSIKKNADKIGQWVISKKSLVAAAYLFKHYAHKTNASLAGRVLKVVKVVPSSKIIFKKIY